MPQRLEFDVIVVGGGCSGLAASTTCARAGLNTVCLERGRSGSKNVMGGVLYVKPTSQVYGEFWREAPVERPVVEQNLWVLNSDSAVKIGYRSQEFGKEPANAYTVLRARIDNWFAKQAVGAGVLQVTNTKVEEVLRDSAGRVIGVRTGRPQGEIYAPITILCEGVNPQLTQQLGMQGEIEVTDMSSLAKEVIGLPPEVIQDRFNLQPDQGATIELFGDSTAGLLGMAWIYTNRDTLSVGVGVGLEDYVHTEVSPHDMLQRFKAHPMVAPLLAGGELREYSSHMIPEGGWRKIPQLYGDGVMVCGDAGMLVNAIHREGSNHAIWSGRLAAETAIEAHQKGNFTRKQLSAYYHRLFKEVPTLKDLRKYRYAMQYPVKHRAVMGVYPELAGYAMREMLTVDGVSKREKEWRILRQVLRARSISGMAYDGLEALRMV